MAYRKFIGGFLFGFALLAGLCAALFFLSTGYLAKSAGVGWAPTLIKAKGEILQRAPSPKAAIISGSNGLFGIDANQLSQTLAMPAYNAACYGGITLPYLEYYTMRHLKAGDYAILPLELGYYEQAVTLNSPTVATAHSIGLDYFHSLPIREKMSYLSMITPKYIRQQMEDRFLPQKAGRRLSYFAYALQPQGDIDLTNGTTDHDAVRREADTKIASAPNPDAMAAICATIKTLQARGVHVVVTEPNAHIVSGSIATYQSLMSKVAEQVQRCGAIFVSVPSQGLLPLEDMLDTYLHPNAQGRRKRTEELARSLCTAGLPCRENTTADAARVN